jgi:hypothetical protein
MAVAALAGWCFFQNKNDQTQSGSNLNTALDYTGKFLYSAGDQTIKGTVFAVNFTGKVLYLAANETGKWLY